MPRVRPEEDYVKKWLKDHFGVNATPVDDDPPDLEFEMNGKVIGVEVVQIMRGITKALTTEWLKKELQKIVPPCLKSFEDEYAQRIRSRGETGCFICRITHGEFMKNIAPDSVTNAINNIEKTITQGLKVIFKLDEVKDEDFFRDEENKLQLDHFWNGYWSGSPVEHGFVEAWGNTYVIETKDKLEITLIRGPYKDTVPDDRLFDCTVFDDPPEGLLIDEGAAVRNEIYEDFKNYVQNVIREKKETCLKKLGQRSQDKYDELWLYIHNELGPNQFFIREDMKAARFDFENYWSKVYCSNVLLKGDKNAL